MSTLNPRKEVDKVRVEQTLVDEFRSAVAEQAAEGTFEEKEAAALAIANELTRRFLEDELQGLADEIGQRIRVDGREYRRHEEGTGHYYSLSGPLYVRRCTYRLVGRICRRGRSGYRGQTRTIVPLECMAGLVERGTPALAFSVAQGYADAPMRQYVDAMAGAHRCVPPRATAERLAKNIAGRVKQEVPTIEPCLRQAERVPNGVSAISMGLDRTSVAMIEERPPGQPPNSRRKRRKRPHLRTPPEPFDVNYRMGYVGTVSLVDAEGRALASRRYAATAEEGPDELVNRLVADVARAQAQVPDLPIVVVQDGAPELWNVVRPALRAWGIHHWHEVIDRFHVNERLADALSMIEPDKDERKRIYNEWQISLDTKQLAYQAISEWIWNNANRAARSNRETVRNHAGYLFDRRIRYAKLKREQLPIASGVTEGTCKSLYAARVKRSGQRWYQDGLTGVLTLRAIRQSDRLSRFWRHFKTHYHSAVSVVV